MNSTGTVVNTARLKPLVEFDGWEGTWWADAEGLAPGLSMEEAKKEEEERSPPVAEGLGDGSVFRRMTQVSIPIQFCEPLLCETCCIITDS